MKLHYTESAKHINKHLKSDWTTDKNLSRQRGVIPRKILF